MPRYPADFAVYITLKPMSISSPITKLLRFAVASVFLFHTCVSFAQSEQSALKMVQGLRLGQNLSGMVYQTAAFTTTFQGVAAKITPKKAFELLVAEIAVVVPKYQDAWDKNLAEAWAPHMSSSEFESLTNQKQQSPHAAKFMSLQNTAGDAMKAKSQPLLAEVVKEVILNVFEKSMSKQ